MKTIFIISQTHCDHTRIYINILITVLKDLICYWFLNKWLSRCIRAIFPVGTLSLPHTTPLC